MQIKLATAFSKAPGPRYSREGAHSGEEFRLDILYPAIQKAISGSETLTVDLDGTFGFGTSFLEEAFGGLIRENGLTLAVLDKCLNLVSLEEPELLNEISQYMHEAEAERIKK